MLLWAHCYYGGSGDPQAVHLWRQRERRRRQPRGSLPGGSQSEPERDPGTSRSQQRLSEEELRATWFREHAPEALLEATQRWDAHQRAREGLERGAPVTVDLAKNPNIRGVTGVAKVFTGTLHPAPTPAGYERPPKKRRRAPAEPAGGRRRAAPLRVLSGPPEAPIEKMETESPRASSQLDPRRDEPHHELRRPAHAGAVARGPLANHFPFTAGGRSGAGPSGVPSRELSEPALLASFPSRARLMLKGTKKDPPQRAERGLGLEAVQSQRESPPPKSKVCEGPRRREKRTPTGLSHGA